MESVDDVLANSGVEEGDDVHHRAANTHMRQIQELAIRRFILFISENRIECAVAK